MMPDPYRIMLGSTADHRMTVLRHDGLYRHIRFAKPGTGIWRFDLITWPGHLVVTGDIEDFHFSRVEDMFQFFRGRVGRINPGYWREKLRGPVQVRGYSPDAARREVVERFLQQRHGLDEAAPVWREIRYEILEDDYVMGDEVLFRQAVGQFRYEDFEFHDVWEWDLREYDFHYLLSLHAIVWGINQYYAQMDEAQ
ncbi:hypothetical protein SEA_MOLLYMUR_107 [Gordonia phage Mollymur]|uniref:Uncharacterized protein n=1 Tax=Gordonia phage Mollymur TaxID=2590895 RepID=A0A4Y6EAM0_9CAUD|nr:hypothetical protein PQB84_gp019 [Gordonia phage Mollymur]QDF15467.1 hypothetical protein SEA_MOLLYMUR_107 [Gordonia phage Mollymur]